ncbi:MAG: glycosyltransferase family 4 protein [Candidatus Omnitrophica bacterium]|nr:glycosyltransferase family 4 protein [Candidatus Omnitrophota bacterium]
MGFGRVTVGLSLLYSGNWSGTGYYTDRVAEALAALAEEGIEGLGLGPENFPFDQPYPIPLRPVPRLSLRWPFERGATWISRDRTQGVNLLHYPAAVGPPRHDLPIVATLHDVGPFLHPEWFPPLKRLYLCRAIRSVVHHARLVLADTQWQAERIRQVFPECAEKLRVVPPVVSAEFRSSVGDAPPEQSETEQSPFILGVGTLEPRKNIERLIQAWRRSGFEGDLLLVGRWGWKCQGIRRLLDSIGAHSRGESGEDVWTLRYGRRVVRREFLPSAELAGLYRTALCLVYPSLFEGFGLPVLEAMACGCPVAVSRDSAMEEVAGEAAWTFDPTDVESMVTMIEQVSGGEGARTARTRAALEESRKLSPQAFAQVLLKAYREAIL